MDGTVTILLAWLRARLGSERGTGLVEYGLVVMLVAVVAIVAVKAFGQGVSTQFSTVNSVVG